MCVCEMGEVGLGRLFECESVQENRTREYEPMEGVYIKIRIYLSVYLPLLRLLRYVGSTGVG